MKTDLRIRVYLNKTQDAKSNQLLGIYKNPKIECTDTKGNGLLYLTDDLSIKFRSGWSPELLEATGLVTANLTMNSIGQFFCTLVYMQ